MSSGMIIIDIPLAITAILFFFLSWAYGWGLLIFFQDRFAWDLASVIGIASVISCTYSLVWIARQSLGVDPIPVLLQIPYDLAIVFLAALPGMTKVRIELRRTEEGRKREVIRLRCKVKEQSELINNIENILDKHEQKAQQRIDELIKVFEMQGRAKELLKEHLNNMN